MLLPFLILDNKLKLLYNRDVKRNANMEDAKMLTSLKELGTYLEKTIERYVPSKKEQQEIALQCKEKHNIPPRVTVPIMSFTKTIEEIGDSGAFIAYCILEAIVDNGGKVDFGAYYTDPETKAFSSGQYDEDKTEFPIVLPMIQVSDDQWIGSITAKELVRFGRSGLIHYEADTQRVMKKVIRGENIFYKISLDAKALEGIEAQYKNGNYIPNTITLNIPEGTGDFAYDTEKRQLVIYSLDAFNITDGYHRYRGLLSVMSDQPDFDCHMEIRITNFSTEKAESFIWQEDKKTKMRKVDSESYNMNDLSNRITKRVNEASDSNIAGLIARADGNINFGEFSSCVKYFYLRNGNFKSQGAAMVTISKQIISFFNKMSEDSPEEFLEKPLGFKNLIVLFYLGAKAPETATTDIYLAMMQKVNESKDRKYQRKEMRRVLETALDAIYNEVTRDV